MTSSSAAVTIQLARSRTSITATGWLQRRRDADPLLGRDPVQPRRQAQRVVTGADDDAGPHGEQPLADRRAEDPLALRPSSGRTGSGRRRVGELVVLAPGSAPAASCGTREMLQT